MFRVWRLPLVPLLVARERRARPGRPRVPEPMVMDDPQAAAEYDEAGAIVQLPVHDLNARAISALLPPGGTVVDLGCASGRLLARLAKGRPDARLIGLDLSDAMLEHGRRLMEREGVADRVELRRGDITTFDTDLAETPDVVSCSFTLHQLPEPELVERCLAAIARIRERTGCAVYLFDLVRLRHPRTWPDHVKVVRFPGPVFEADTIASEAAAYTFEELTAMCEAAGLRDLRRLRARPLGEYQVHLAPGQRPVAPGRWQPVPVPAAARLATAATRSGFPRSLTG